MGEDFRASSLRIPNSPPHLLPLLCLPWAFSGLWRLRGPLWREKVRPGLSATLQFLCSGCRNLSPRASESAFAHSQYRGPTPPPGGQQGYCSRRRYRVQNSNQRPQGAPEQAYCWPTRCQVLCKALRLLYLTIRVTPGERASISLTLQSRKLRPREAVCFV